MIDIIASYCADNRLLLNAKPGKTEVIEFMCPPSGRSYTVAAPTKDDPLARAALRVSQGYPYLGWWLDPWLTLDTHTANVAASVLAATSKIYKMGGFPGGLPVQTILHLWSSLALSYVHGAAALLEPHHIEKLQRKLDWSVSQLLGAQVSTLAVWTDFGLPDAAMIHEMRLAALIHRLETLPLYLTPAALHRLLANNPSTRTRGFEGRHALLVARHGAAQAPTMSAPAPTLGLTLQRDGSILDPIRQARKRAASQWKKKVWAARKAALLAEAATPGASKRSIFLCTTQTDLQRTNLRKPAQYLQSNLGGKHKLALFQLRSQSTLLAADAVDDDDEPDAHCDACHTYLCTLRDRLAELQARNPPPAAGVQRVKDEILAMEATLQHDPPENHEHALFHCVKGKLPQHRESWAADLEDIFKKFAPREARSAQSAPPLTWHRCPRATQLSLALGSAPPDSWWFLGTKPHSQLRVHRAMHAAILQVTAAFALILCKNLRDYRRAVMQDVAQANTMTWSNAARLLAPGAALDGDTSSDSDDSDS